MKLDGLRRAMAMLTGIGLALTGVTLSRATAEVATCDGETATIVGTTGVPLSGTPGNDIIVTNGADGTAGDGDDLICVTGATTTVDAGAGDDRVDTRVAQTSAHVGGGGGTDSLVPLSCCGDVPIVIDDQGGTQTIAGTEQLTFADFAVFDLRTAASNLTFVGSPAAETLLLDDPAAASNPPGTPVPTYQLDAQMGDGDDQVRSQVRMAGRVDGGPGDDSVAITTHAGGADVHLMGWVREVGVRVLHAPRMEHWEVTWVHDDACACHVGGMSVHGTPGPDDVRVTERTPDSATSVSINGRAGDDRLALGAFGRMSGGLGDDRLTTVGTAGVGLSGGPGRDVLVGGPGDDTVVSDSPTKNGTQHDIVRTGAGGDLVTTGVSGLTDDDTIFTGSGRDHVQVLGRPKGLHVDGGSGRNRLRPYGGMDSGRVSLDNRTGVLRFSGRVAAHLSGFTWFWFPRPPVGGLRFRGSGRPEQLWLAVPFFMKRSRQPRTWDVDLDLGGGDDRVRRTQYSRPVLAGRLTGGPGRDRLFSFTRAQSRLDLDLTGWVTADGHRLLHLTGVEELLWQNFVKHAPVTVTGSTHDDVVSIGSDSPVTMHGRGGDDYLDGSIGNDVLVGGPGKDRAVGRTGKDRCAAESERGCELPVR